MQPLAELMRPQNLTNFVGQHHLLDQGKPLAEMIQHKRLSSMILWGPPGVGKTTLAKIMINLCGYEALYLSAVFSGIKEIKQALLSAENSQNGLFNQPFVLFVDEIHRFNKAQQDAFLQDLENGNLILIGATTENPSFELNNALLSRMQVYVLESLSSADLHLLLERAIAKMLKPQLTLNAKNLLVDLSNGDARRLLNLYELVATTSKSSTLDAEQLRQIIPRHLQIFDKDGEEFYNQISALHKSIRGSNPDAALYWFGRMLAGGASVLYIGRRLLRMAWEDIGLADSNAATVVNNALQTYERLGSPEGELALAGAVIYLATAEKSNSVEIAYNKLREFINDQPSRPVPVHLRNAPTKLLAELGYGKNYRYAHDYPEHYVPNEQYFPDDMHAPQFYTPTNLGDEQQITAQIAKRKWLDDQDKLG